MSKKKVMLVDDNEQVLTVTTRILSAMGWEVLAFPDPQVAVEIVDKINPKIDLLFTDFNMPRMNGAELIKIIKEKKPNIKTICMSGLDNKKDCDSNGCNIFLSKPVGVSEIQMAVDELFPPRSR